MSPRQLTHILKDIWKSTVVVGFQKKMSNIGQLSNDIGWLPMTYACSNVWCAQGRVFTWRKTYRVLAEDAAKNVVGGVASPGTDHVSWVYVFHINWEFQRAKMSLHLHRHSGRSDGMSTLKSNWLVLLPKVSRKGRLCYQSVWPDLASQSRNFEAKTGWINWNWLGRHINLEMMQN